MQKARQKVIPRGTFSALLFCLFNRNTYTRYRFFARVILTVFPAFQENPSPCFHFVLRAILNTGGRVTCLLFALDCDECTLYFIISFLTPEAPRGESEEAKTLSLRRLLSAISITEVWKRLAIENKLSEASG